MPLKIYTNESVPVAVAAGLKRRGIDAVSARDSGNLGLSDPDQLEYANNENAVIFSHDDDFLRLAHQWILEGRKHSGAIYVHQEKLSLGECVKRLEEIALLFEREDFFDHIEFL
ncbi:MAG: hypothetical protein GY803_29525 [Chloroflexi bacterium]|nr:hypothetical protein [Chloroflexota bacterium]